MKIVKKVRWEREGERDKGIKKKKKKIKKEKNYTFSYF